MWYRSKTQSCGEWLVKVNGASGLITEFKVFYLLNGLVRNPNNGSLSTCLEKVEKFCEFYERFENKIQNEFCHTASYWNSYLDMVQTLLDYQRTLRTGDYFESSTKALGWKQRRVSGTILHEFKRLEQKGPNQYAKVLQNPGNKMFLAKFLLNGWKKKRVNSFQEKKRYAIFDNKGLE